MPNYPKLTMADHYRAVLAAIEINARTYATKPPHASTYNARNAPTLT